MKALTDAVSSWDGQSVRDLEPIYQRVAEQPALVDELLLLLEREPLQEGVSWLLKRHLENANPLSARQSTVLVGLLAKLSGWQARLHILQLFGSLSFERLDSQPLETFLRRALADDNKFIRAWAYHGFYLLQRHFPRFTEEVQSFFAMAMVDEAPSVKARIRHIVKEYGFEFQLALKR